MWRRCRRSWRSSSTMRASRCSACAAPTRSISLDCCSSSSNSALASLAASSSACKRSASAGYPSRSPIVRRACSSSTPRSCASAAEEARSASVCAKATFNSSSSLFRSSSVARASRLSAWLAANCSSTSANLVFVPSSCSTTCSCLSSQCLRRPVRFSTSTTSPAIRCGSCSAASLRNVSLSSSSDCTLSRSSMVIGSSKMSFSGTSGPRSRSSAMLALHSFSCSSKIARSPSSRRRSKSDACARAPAARTSESRSLTCNSKSRVFAFHASNCWPMPLSWPSSWTSESRSPAAARTFSLLACSADLRSPTSSRRWFWRSRRPRSMATSSPCLRKICTSASRFCNSSRALLPSSACRHNSLTCSSFCSSCFCKRQLRSKLSNSPSKTAVLFRPTCRSFSTCSVNSCTLDRNLSFSTTRA
mmetsp:Transcript_25925/g.78025  ORF Transcript_25925/g.78025 Transcript_25925/m.78025 type:complete len:418 (-) Transcript_25925:126-1379(-)